MFERLDSYGDVLTQVMESVRLGGALSARSTLRAPWALRFDERDKRASFHIVANGDCWVTLADGSTPQRLGAGDVVVFPNAAEHVLGDDPATVAVDFASLVAGVVPGGRVDVPHGDGPSTTLLCGTYSVAGDTAGPLLRGLPDMLHVPATARSGPLGAAIAVLDDETARLDQGSAVVVDRLVDVLFVLALRAWFEIQEGPPTTWFGALHDPVVGPAVKAIHEQPGRAWTVTDLGRLVGLSRAAFARRFSAAVGEPPLSYVTRWRMTIAADMLANGDPVASVARHVGYDDPFAFAKAFKRVRGIAPGAHRRQHAS